MSTVLIIGCNGSMGKRYQAILNHLGLGIALADINTPQEKIDQMAELADGIVIATPTETHLYYINRYARSGLPILCEKPLSKSEDELDLIEQIVKESGLNLTMMMQYKMLDKKGARGITVYDYFRHGNDGLYWDCLQPIALARTSVKLREKSPIWTCKLNGVKLSLNDMDGAYVDFVKRWLRRPGDNIDYLIDIHHKVMEYESGKAG